MDVLCLQKPLLICRLEGMFREGLSECLERGEDGRHRMTIPLPDAATLDRLSKSLGKMITV